MLPQRCVSGTSGEPHGTVGVTASEFVGVEVLPAILTTFRTPQPKIDIELSLSNHKQDLTWRDADIAVRMAAPTQTSLIARKLGDMSVGLCPSPLSQSTRHAADA